MSVYTCIGIRHLDFEGSDGKPVRGMNLYMSFKDPNIQGVGSERFFVSDANLMNLSYMPEVGSSCDVLFNKYGKISDIRAV